MEEKATLAEETAETIKLEAELEAIEEPPQKAVEETNEAVKLETELEAVEEATQKGVEEGNA